MIILRYADDTVVGFEHEADARRFLEMMRARLEEFALSLHPEKTRLIEFGRKLEPLTKSFVAAMLSSTDNLLVSGEQNATTRRSNSPIGKVSGLSVATARRRGRLEGWELNRGPRCSVR